MAKGMAIIVHDTTITLQVAKALGLNIVEGLLHATA